ncbi:hypothetical protein [Bradyrhizobium brasilense]|nr:hypothetical protein [Bradyrhizobium brasilense]
MLIAIEMVLARDGLGYLMVSREFSCLIRQTCFGIRGMTVKPT